MKEFLDKLSSCSHAPGGGSVAALGGALSASLLSMVSNLTIGKKKYSKIEDEMKECLADSETFREEMTFSIDEDTAAFNELMTAYKMDRMGSESEDLRDRAIQKAISRTINVPLTVAERCVALLKLAIEVADKGNVNAITDTGVAVLMADSALKGALFNVRINLRSIKDLGMKNELNDSVIQLMKEGEYYRDKALAIVEAKLGDKN